MSVNRKGCEELGESEIARAAEESLEAVLARPGMNEWRALFVALGMIGEVMDRTGARVAVGHAAVEVIRDLAGREAMEGLRMTQRKAFAAKRRRWEGEF